MSDKQIQKAGDSSTQYQANVINQYDGVSEERVIEIIDDRCEIALSNCIYESRLIAEQRVSDFKSEILELLVRRPGLADALQEPACVSSLEMAVNAAAKSPDSRDWKLLSELLGKRLSEPQNRHVAAGINKAIEIVDLLTDEELNGLTVYFALNQFVPVSSSVQEGLSSLDDLYEKLPIDNLPQGDDWIDNLDIHSALRITPFTSLKKLVDVFYLSLGGYVVWGFENDAEPLNEACQSLTNAGMPTSILIEHELHEGYSRLNVRNREHIHELVLTKVIGETPTTIPLDPKQINVLDKIYEQTIRSEHEAEMKERFEEKLRSYPSISKVIDWWDSIPSAPRITVVGKAIAYANAKRIDPSLPELKI